MPGLLHHVSAQSCAILSTMLSFHIFILHTGAQESHAGLRSQKIDAVYSETGSRRVKIQSTPHSPLCFSDILSTEFDEKKNKICLHDWEESVALEGRRCLITNRMINKAEVVIKKSVICHINEHWTLLSLFICVEMFQIQTGLLCFHSLVVQNQLRQVPEPRQGSALLLRIRHAGTEHTYKYTYLLMLKGIKRDPRTGGKK